MNESAVSQIREFIDSSETIGIVVGKNPTVDEMGAALALYLSLQSSGKAVSLASATEPTVELSSLIGIDKVRDSFEAEGGDLIVSFPYREGEIDKVSYTLEEGSLNIVVKPGELGLSFTEQDVIFKRKGEYPSLILTIGVSRISDLSSILDVSKAKDAVIVNIDNKTENQGFGEVVVVSTEASSVSEMISKFLISAGLEIDLDVAQNLLSGISDATSNFQSPKTTAYAFEMAGVLMQKGAVRQARGQFEERAFIPQDQGKVLQELSKIQHQQKRFERAIRPQQTHGQAGGGQEELTPKRDNQSQAQDVSVSNAGQIPQNPPEDWLTPKVYKGSTNV